MIFIKIPVAIKSIFPDMLTATDQKLQGMNLRSNKKLKKHFNLYIFILYCYEKSNNNL